MTRPGTFAVGLLSFTLFARAAEPPLTRPTVPAFVVGKASFVARFVFAAAAGDAGGVGVEIASGAARERTILFDAADGTPIFLSDGVRTLVYDLAGGRVVLVASSRGFARFDFDPRLDRPMNFTFGVRAATGRKLLADDVSSVRLDRFPDAATFIDDAGDPRYVLEREGTFTLHVAAHAARFTMADAADGTTAELAVTSIGGPDDAARLAFPDVARLRADGVPVDEIDAGGGGAGVAAFLGLLANGQVILPKVGLAGGERLRGTLARAMPAAGWAGLARRDATLGATYRAALAKQAIALLPTTRPAGE